MSLFLIYELFNLISWFSETCSPRVFEKDRHVVSVSDTDTLDEKIGLHPTRVKTMPLWIPVQMLCHPPQGGGGLPYVGYIGIFLREGYGFQAVYFGIGLKIRRFGPRIGYHFPGN